MIKFTKEEKIALIFLLAALFTGTIIVSYKKARPLIPGSVGFTEKKEAPRNGININEAGEKELTKLVNIGPVLARRIILYREEHGSFGQAREITNVKGIGDKTYEKIKEKILLE